MNIEMFTVDLPVLDNDESSVEGSTSRSVILGLCLLSVIHHWCVAVTKDLDVEDIIIGEALIDTLHECCARSPDARDQIRQSTSRS